MKEIKLIAQPNDQVYFIADDGRVFLGVVNKIHLHPLDIRYIINHLGMYYDRAFVGNTLEELLENVKNEYLQRTPIT